MMVCAHICDFIHRTRTSNRVGIKTGGTAGGLIGKAGRRLILGLSLLKNTDQSHRMAQMQPGLIQRASERWTSPAQSYCESTWSGFKSRFYLLVWIMNLTSHKFSFLIYKLGTFTELWGLKKKKYMWSHSHSAWPQTPFRLVTLVPQTPNIKLRCCVRLGRHSLTSKFQKLQNLGFWGSLYFGGHSRISLLSFYCFPSL